MLKRISAFCMCLSVVPRLVYYLGFYPNALNMETWLVHIFLPVMCALVFAYMLFSNCSETTTVIPLYLGCLFFIIKALSFAPLHMALCILLYLTVAVLYTLSVTGKIKPPLVLILLFALPLAAHIGMDVSEIANGAELLPLLPELSVLLIMTALLLFAVSRTSCNPLLNRKKP